MYRPQKWACLNVKKNGEFKEGDISPLFLVQGGTQKGEGKESSFQHQGKYCFATLAKDNTALTWEGGAAVKKEKNTPGGRMKERRGASQPVKRKECLPISHNKWQGGSQKAW